MGQIPDVFDELIRSLRRSAAGEKDQRKLIPSPDIGSAHGEARGRARTPPVRAVQDFGILCDTIASLADEERADVSPSEWQIVNALLDTAISGAISKHWEMASARQRQESAEEVGFFAHELRNSLNAALAGFEVLRTGRVGLQSKTADVVERSLRSSAELVHQLLANARLASGCAPDRNLVHVRKWVCDVCARTPGDSSVKVSVSVPEELTAIGDENLLTLALRNLIHNGIKFTRAGGTVEVRARRLGSAIIVEVEDECGGLDRELDDLFQPFVRNASSKGGSGLGLAIARRAAGAHGGTVEAENIPGKGCIFRLVFPDVP